MSRKSPPSLQPRGSKLHLKAFKKHLEAIAYLYRLKRRKIPPRCVGIALRDRTPRGELIPDLDLFEAGTVTAALGGGLLAPLLKWIVPVASVRVAGLGPVVAGGVFARAFGIKRSSSRSPWLSATPDEALDHLGVSLSGRSEFVAGLRSGEILVAFYQTSGTASTRRPLPGGHGALLSAASLSARWDGMTGAFSGSECLAGVGGKM